MSSPNWWGDWRPTLTPHTGNLLATDLIECTMIVGGLPVNTVITGAQILGAVPSGGGLDIGTSPITSGTVGRILFQGTGNVLQQSANLFWNNTNSRLGIGTASPSYTLQVAGTIKATGGTQAGAIFGAGVELTLGSDAYIQCTSTTGKNAGLTIHRFSTSEYASLDFLNGGSFATGWSIQSRPSSTRLDIVDRNPTDNIRMCFHNGGNIGIGTTTNAGYKLDVNGTSRFSGLMLIANGLQFGQTGAESYLNTTGATAIQINRKNITLSNGADNQLTIEAGNGGGSIAKIWLGGFAGTQPLCFNGNGRESVFGLDTATPSTSALIRMESTTKGFLPPRMTTTQKNAIATPAAGLVVYDTTLNKLCVRTASAWETITSV